MKGKYNFEHTSFPSLSELDEEIKTLMLAAKAQLKRSYAPYSNFKVGAAVLLENNEIYLGCNQENASFPLCICAERVALYAAAAHEDTFRIKALAITASNPVKPLTEACMPCGACRQVIQEYEIRQNSSFDLYLSSEENEIIKVTGIQTLLPNSFSKDLLL